MNARGRLVALLVLAAGCGLDSMGSLEVGGEQDASVPDATTGFDAPAFDAPAADGAAPDAFAFDAFVQDVVADSPADSLVDSLADAPTDVTADSPDGAEDSPADATKDSPADAPLDSPLDSPVDANDGCAMQTEICNDGIDNNCNGLVDCADPQCGAQGYSCAPTAPAGWRVVAFEANTRPPCPTGYGAPTLLVEGPTSGSTCSCTCGAPQANPCTQGSVTLHLGHANCGGATGTYTATSDGKCDPIGPIDLPSNGPYLDDSTQALASSTVACAANAALPPPAFVAKGELCTPSAGAGGGCGAASECLPVVPAPNWCIEATGDVVCPSGFTQRHVVDTPADLVDGRSCSACTCSTGATSCTNPQVTVFTNSSCTTGAVSMVADGVCHNFSGNPTGAAYFTYTATPGGEACVQGPPSTVSGSIQESKPSTICCP